MSVFLRILKGIGIGLLYLISGVIVLGIFAGGLYVSGGVLSGYPVLVFTLVLAALWFRFLYRRCVSTGGFILRGLPVVVALGIVIWAMIPMPQHEFSNMQTDERFENWDLGSGRIAAVAQFAPPENVIPREETVVFVHGGPGVYLRDFDLDFISGFTADGFNVVMYDQVGAGRSSIVQVSEYSHQGNVNDLKQILDRIDTPLILIGQSYGAALITSYLSDYGNDQDISNIILSEPGPLPGSEYSNSDPKTTKAANAEGVSITDVLSSPRIILAFLLPATNQFVDQEEMLHFIGPELQKAAVAVSYCAQHEDQMLPFEHHRVNFLATMAIMDSFLNAETPDLTDLDIPVLLLLAECSYIPRQYALNYFDHIPVSRSHWIPEVGHVLWATPEGRKQTHESILSFINNTEPSLPNKPTYDTRTEFLEAGL